MPLLAQVLRQRERLVQRLRAVQQRELLGRQVQQQPAQAHSAQRLRVASAPLAARELDSPRACSARLRVLA